MSTFVSTSFRDALVQSVEGKRNLGRFGSQVLRAAQTSAGRYQGDGWNARLSYRTAQKLKQEGVL